MVVSLFCFAYSYLNFRRLGRLQMQADQYGVTLTVHENDESKSGAVLITKLYCDTKTKIDITQNK